MQQPACINTRAAIIVRSGIRIADHLEEAQGFVARLRGLLGRQDLAPGSGLLIHPCQGIHTVGMRFAIDALFLDRRDRVARVEHSLPPGRFVPFVRRAARVIELPAGTLAAAGVEVGDEVWLVGSETLHRRACG
jgi:uncharacterized protein